MLLHSPASHAVATGQCGDARWLLFSVGPDAPLALAAAASLLSIDELSRADRFHFSHDRERWMRSRAWLRLTLADWLKIPSERLHFSLEEYGRPFLKSHPLAHFNISHSGGFAAILLAGSAGQGIDLERCDPQFPHLETAAEYFPPGEQALLEASLERAVLFTTLWTAREAVMKATGLGLNLPPADIRLDLVDGQPALAWLPDGTCHTLKSWRPVDDFILTVARKTEPTMEPRSA